MTMGFKKMMAEFKAFAFKGNMIDLAVAVVIGAAFSNVIQAMVADIINPAISYAVSGVKEAGTTATSVSRSVENGIGVKTQSSGAQAATGASASGSPPTAATAAPAPSGPVRAVSFEWKVGRFLIGDFVGAIINFVIQAFAVFILIVKLSGSVLKRVGGTPEPSEPTTKECRFCLSVIPMRATKCPHCTADLPQAGAAPTMA